MTWLREHVWHARIAAYGTIWQVTQNIVHHMVLLDYTLHHRHVCDNIPMLTVPYMARATVT